MAKSGRGLGLLSGVMLGVFASAGSAQIVFTKLAYTGELSGVGTRVFTNSFSLPLISGPNVSYYAALNQVPGALPASVSQGAVFRDTAAGGRTVFAVDANFAAGAGDNIYSLSNAAQPNDVGQFILATRLDGFFTPPVVPEAFSALYSATQASGPTPIFVGGDPTPQISDFFEPLRTFQGPASFFDEDINDAGQILFGSWLDFDTSTSTTPPPDRVAYFAGPLGDLRLIFKGGNPTPGFTGGTFEVVVLDSARLNEQGDVLYVATFSAPGLDQFQSIGIFAGRYDAVTLRFRPGSTVDGFVLNSWALPFLNNIGKLCMGALLNDGVLNYQAVVFGNLANPQVLIKTGDSAPDNPSLFIETLAPTAGVSGFVAPYVSANDADEVAFTVARFEEEVLDEFGDPRRQFANMPATVYAGTASNLRVVVRVGDPLPGTWTDAPQIAGFLDPVINNQGRVLIRAFVLSASFQPSDALVLYERDGSATTLVRTGEQFAASAGNFREIAPNINVTWLNGLDRDAGFNHSGQVVFGLSFIDPAPPGLITSSGIYVATPPAPPGQPPVLQSVRSRKVHG